MPGTERPATIHLASAAFSHLPGAFHQTTVAAKLKVLLAL